MHYIPVDYIPSSYYCVKHSPSCITLCWNSKWELHIERSVHIWYPWEKMILAYISGCYSSKQKSWSHSCNQMWTVESLLGKKKCLMLTKGKLDEICARAEHFPRKSLRCLALEMVFKFALFPKRNFDKWMWSFYKSARITCSNRDHIQHLLWCGWVLSFVGP